MKRAIYFTLAIVAMIVASACEKDNSETQQLPKDAKGQWLIASGDGLMLVDVRHTVENSFLIAYRVPKAGYDPSTEETPSTDPYDPNYQWAYAPNAVMDSSGKTKEGEWTVIANTGLPEENSPVIKYSITPEDILICKIGDILENEEMIVVCSRLDPPVELTADDDK